MKLNFNIYKYNLYATPDMRRIRNINIKGIIEKRENSKSGLLKNGGSDQVDRIMAINREKN